MTKAQMFAIALAALSSGCMLKDYGNFTRSRVLEEAPPTWKFYNDTTEANFYGEGIRISLDAAIATERVVTDFTLHICALVFADSKYAGIAFDPSRVLLAARGVNATAVLKHSSLDRPMGPHPISGAPSSLSCWDLKFGDVAVDRGHPYTIGLDGSFSARGVPVHLPAVEFTYTEKYKSICILAECLMGGH
jgi:hypothetical protein